MAPSAVLCASPFVQLCRSSALARASVCLSRANELLRIGLPKLTTPKSAVPLSSPTVSSGGSSSFVIAQAAIRPASLCPAIRQLAHWFSSLPLLRSIDCSCPQLAILSRFAQSIASHKAWLESAGVTQSSSQFKLLCPLIGSAQVLC